MSEATNTFEAVKEEVKANVVSRFSSPFLGAFIVSWLIWNHRLVLVLLSEMSIDERFTYIDDQLYPTALVFLAMNVVGPLASTLAYIFLLPWPTEWVHVWNLRRKRRLREAELRSEGRRLLTEDEGRALRSQITELKERADVRRVELRKTTRRLNAISMLSHGVLGERFVNSAIAAYLTSQPFQLDKGPLGYGPRPWSFASNGEVDIPDHQGNFRWRVIEGKVHIVNADEDTNSMGELIFNPRHLRFEGDLSGIGTVFIQGAAHETDFQNS